MRRPSRLTYPEGIRGWIAKVDASPNGGLAIDPNSSSHSTASDRTRSGSKAEIPRSTRFAIHDQRMQCVGRPITGTRIGRGLSEDDPTFYVIEGHLRLFLREPKEEVQLGPGDTYSVRPRRPHLVTNAGDRSATFLVLQGIGEYDYVPLV